MLLLKDFYKAYHEKVILKIPEMTLNRGLYWIKGANGSGKSTFFKAICGIIPFDGECELDGINLKKRPVAYRKKISYCEAEPLYPEFLTLKDLMKFVANTKASPAEQQEELTTALGLKDFFEQPVKTYSSGMLKKSGLALAFLGQSSVICLDEPFITIDRESLERLIRLIGEYHKNHGVTFLISSHVEDPETRLGYSKIFEIKDKSIVELNA